MKAKLLLNKIAIINYFTKIVLEIKSNFENDFSGHDWHHIERVYSNALKIQLKEGGDLQVISLLAVLHDVSDHKLNGGKLNQGGVEAQKIMQKIGIDSEIIAKVYPLIDEISFKGANVADGNSCLESQIVQDADRLDAIGAIGIARAFAYGGSRGRPMYAPEVTAELHDSFEAYAKSQSHTINHFHEKLLLISDRMHTATGKKMAKERHDFMLGFLDQFHNEWGTPQAL